MYILFQKRINSKLRDKGSQKFNIHIVLIFYKNNRILFFRPRLNDSYYFSADFRLKYPCEYSKIIAFDISVLECI